MPWKGLYRVPLGLLNFNFAFMKITCALDVPCRCPNGCCAPRCNVNGPTCAGSMPQNGLRVSSRAQVNFTIRRNGIRRDL